MVTQVQIARRLRMDVSTINKILNGVPGPVFSESTVTKVVQTARDMGYDFDRPHKGNLKSLLQDLFPKSVEDVVLSGARGISVDKVRQIKSLIYKIAIVLLTLKFFIMMG